MIKNQFFLTLLIAKGKKIILKNAEDTEWNGEYFEGNVKYNINPVL